MRKIAPLVWIARILVGGTFVFSGFAKAVDPWGFMYKIEEYFITWGVVDWVPREIVFIAAALLAMFEFCAGLMLMLGSMRRISVLSLLALMALMLPLSAYIWIADPVSDCGCFGDAWVIPNWATFVKNVVLTALLVFLVPANSLVSCAVKPLYQWLPVTTAALCCLVVSIVGYMAQPVVDFRPYKIGQSLMPDEAADDLDLLMIYEKDGEEAVFSADNLPDSTWTYVGRKSTVQADKRQFEIFEGDNQVTDYVIESVGPQMLLVVSDPEYHGRARASLANRVNEYVMAQGGSMIGLLPYRGEELEAWRQLTSPDFELFSVDRNLLKELARGDAALVYLKDGIVQWKRNIYSFSGDFPDKPKELERKEMHEPVSEDIEDTDLRTPEAVESANVLDKVWAPENGRLVRFLSVVLAISIVLAFVAGLRPKKKPKAKE